MRYINDENIDEIMFQLLEGDIIGKEREQLLEAIYADPAYAALWETWQKTVLTPEKEDLDFDAASLKKKSRTKVLPLFIKYAVAAMLVIACSIGLFYIDRSSQVETFEVVENNPAVNPGVSKLPQLNKDTVSIRRTAKDTFMPLRQKVRYMAHRNKPSPHKGYDSLPANLTPVPQSNEITELALVPDVITDLIPSDKKEINPAEDVIVLVSHENPEPNIQNDQKTNKSLFARIFGQSKVRIEEDENTRTQKKIIIENKKYQIIAGF